MTASHFLCVLQIVVSTLGSGIKRNGVMKIKADRFSSISRLALSYAALQISFVTSALGQSYTNGAWGSVFDWSYSCPGGPGDGASVSVHTHMLPTGKVMIYTWGDCPKLWDPGSTSAPVALPGANYDAFCGGLLTFL